MIIMEQPQPIFFNLNLSNLNKIHCGMFSFINQFPLPSIIRIQLKISSQIVMGPSCHLPSSMYEYTLQPSSANLAAS